MTQVVTTVSTQVVTTQEIYGGTMEDLTHSTDLAFRRMAKESDEILNTILAPGHPTGGVSSDRPICPRTACQSLLRRFSPHPPAVQDAIAVHGRFFSGVFRIKSNATPTAVCLPEVRKLSFSRSVQAFGRHSVTPLKGSALDVSRHLQLGAFSPGYYFVQFWYFPLTAGEEFLGLLAHFVA